MARALLLNEAYIYENTAIDENVNYDLIRPVLWNAQELYIKDIIGQPLYEVITAEIIANNGTLTTSRLLTLVNDYIAPCLLHYTLMDAQVTMLYKMRNLAVQTQRSDYSDPIDYQTHNYLKDDARMKAEQYAERIERYLCANLSTYPEYTTYTSSDQVRAQVQKPKTSMFLGGASKVGFDWEYPRK